MTGRKGLTQIELLIVVVNIGILVAIAIPKFANTREKAVVASMKSDLRDLVTAQNSFFTDNQDYAGGTDPATRTNGKAGAGKVAFSPSAGNVLVVSYGSAAGWSATVTNPAVKSTASDECGIYLGTAAAPDPSLTTAGAPCCY
jgi:Tfp pilus assembly protein PilE